MKTKLDEAREIINEVDHEMINLFIKRMAAVSMVAEHKLENGIAVLDTIREEQIKAKNLELLCNKQLEEYYLTFFEGVLNASKAYQAELIKKYEEKK